MIIFSQLLYHQSPFGSRPNNDSLKERNNPTKILACSVVSQVHEDLMNSRNFCEDRRGFFEHIYPKRLLKSTVRVVVVQSTHLGTHFLNDQLKEEMEKDKLVEEKKMTRAEAEQELELWQEQEWQRRMEEFPRKVMVAWVKYQAIIFVMRLYEYIASKFVDERTLDKLTLDTFEYSKRRMEVRSDKSEVIKDMLPTCWNANLFAYLADYSVHQVILAFGYYTYVQRRRHQRRLKNGLDSDQEDDIHSGSLGMSYLRKSTMLAISRGLWLCFASVGGAVGTVFMPGWGTLAGINLGDGFAASFTEEMTNGVP